MPETWAAFPGSSVPSEGRAGMAPGSWPGINAQISKSNKHDITMEELKKEIKQLFKQRNQWHFVNRQVGERLVRIKFYVGAMETDVQVFQVDGVHQAIGFNYGRPTRTLEAISEVLNNLK